ncbi:binding-protein-dependent transport systems inner membrane component [Dehalogenimonas lykanthroporepellens BL-DC-9]|nr:binding-protein-dependent transport systems inner membrane component [Dehalogenimonas lykanthroporepellens BL-DC-9]
MWPFNLYTIPLDDWIQSGVNWLSQNFRSFFQIVKTPFDFTLSGTEDFLLWLPPVVVLGLIFLIAWQIKGWKFAAISTLTMLFVGFLGLWAPTMTTLSLVLAALIFCAIVGIPLGILAARSDKFAGILRPLLDAMQTIPAFVYLVPVVMLFGVGLVPGLIAVIVFALPPIIRLTDLGIRQVPQDVVEAGRSFGGTNNQILFNIQIPLAMPTIMAGLNQTLMLAMSMAVVIALIGASGLGLVVWTGLGRNDVGYAAIGGIGIVAIAIILDRLSQSFSKSPTGKKQPGLLGRSINWLRSRLNKNRRN